MLTQQAGLTTPTAVKDALNKAAPKVLTLLALLVQKYAARRVSTAVKDALNKAAPKVLYSLYLIYWYKSTHADAARHVSDGAADRGARLN